MLALRKYRPKIPIKKLISITFITWWSNYILWHFDYLLRDDLIWLFTSLYRALFLDLKLRRNILFKTHSVFAIDILKLRLFGYFLIFSKERIFRLSKFFLEYKFTTQMQLTCNNDIEEAIFVWIDIRMLINMWIKFRDLSFDFINEGLIFNFFNSLMSQHVFIKLI
jgi:hypothetical protein